MDRNWAARKAHQDPTYGALIAAETEEPEETVKGRRAVSVYFLHAPALRRVKIGFSHKPASRLEEIRRLIPKGFELDLLGAIDGGQRTERVIHERFAEHRVSGEWFDDSIRPDVEALLVEDREWFGVAA